MYQQCHVFEQNLKGLKDVFCYTDQFDSVCEATDLKTANVKKMVIKTVFFDDTVKFLNKSRNN